MSSLATELPEEIDRNRKLLELYKGIGPAGAFGAAFIDQDIKAGVNALASGDVIQMLQAYKKLKENES